MLSRISSDYYLLLEQRRDNRPSSQVLDALAGAALQLDVKASDLHQLAGLTSRHLALGGR